MTNIKTGDKGQRYQVECKQTEDVKHTIFGWSDNLDGAKRMYKGISLHPVWCSPRILDRETGMYLNILHN